MAYKYKQNLANRKNYGGRRSLAAIKYIGLHYTGNDGDSADANANYFKKNIVKASAHYFVDDTSVVQSVPDDYVAWSVGGKKYMQTVPRPVAVLSTGNAQTQTAFPWSCVIQ